jgi:hypothetical protein
MFGRGMLPQWGGVFQRLRSRRRIARMRSKMLSSVESLNCPFLVVVPELFGG